MSHEKLKDDYLNAFLTMDRFNIYNITEEHLTKIDVVEELLVPTLETIGKGWEDGIYSLSQVYVSGVIGEEIIEKFFKSDAPEEKSDINIGIVTFDDYHSLGKKIVYMNLKSMGYKIIDFGMIFDEEKLIKKVLDNNVELLLMSVLMLPPALRITDIKNKLKKQKPSIRIVVGGAPFRFDRNLYKQIGVDGMGVNANDVVGFIKQMEVAK